MIVIIDYGLGNLGSIKNMIKKVGFDSMISSDKDQIIRATKLILPGVGSFDRGMTELKKRGLIDILNDLVQEKQTPILGICLGMQLMTKSSEEGTEKGLGWINAEVKHFSFEENTYKVPHMGWNYIYEKKESSFFKPDEKNRFYFVHSYYVQCNYEEDILSTSTYGFEFVSSFKRKNIMGIQCHPEKSHEFGIHFLKQFIEQ
jgi:imidazole glycerol-phosphate synthase subunit HisH